MEKVRFECAKCQQPLEADTDMAGETIRCPKCMVDLVIPQPDPAKPSTPPTPPHQQSQSEQEVRIKKPNLFWRRIASVIVDMLFLDILVFTAQVLPGIKPVGVLLAGGAAFFGIWFVLHLKGDLSVGKLLVQIRTTRTKQSGEKSSILVARFALTWLPLLVMELLVYDPALATSGGTSAFIIISFIWYFGILVSLIVTKGRRGLHDMIVKCVTDFKTAMFLSAPRKIVAALAAVVFVCETAFGAFMYMASSADPTLSEGQSSSEIPTYDRNARYSAQQIRDFYRGRVFEVETRWQRPGGFLWMDTVWERRWGSAFMFVNNRQYGLLASNWHVVEPSQNISGEYECRVRRSPQESYVEGHVVAKAKHNCDLALILIELEGEPEPTFAPISSSDKLKQGEGAVAIGNALGRGISVTDGVISKLDGYMIVTSTPISSGSSGGPLFLCRGALFAGVTTAAINSDRAQNINYAIPAEYLSCPHNWEFIVDDPSPITAMLSGEEIK